MVLGQGAQEDLSLAGLGSPTALTRWALWAPHLPLSLSLSVLSSAALTHLGSSDSCQWSGHMASAAWLSGPEWLH